MEETREHRCGRVGMKVSLLCATMAAAVPLIFTAPYAGDWLRYPLADKLTTLAGFVIVAGVFYAAAALLGKAAGRSICRKKQDLGGAIGLGMGVAFGSLAAAAVAVELAILIVKLSAGQREMPGLTLVMIFLFGALPAALLGLLYGVLARRRLIKAGCLEGPPESPR